MRRIRVPVVPFLLAVPALALAGCAGSGSSRTALSDPFASRPASSPPASAPVAPSTPTPTSPPTPTPACVPTANMGETERRDYLKHLKNSEPRLPMALFATDSGVHIFPEEARRPCSAVPVRLGHFRVDMERAISGSAQYSFTYAPINTVTVSVGPQDGTAPGSRPPAAQNCSGTLSVVYVGKDITADELPDELSFRNGSTSLKWTSVDFADERVLDTVFVPPPDAKSC
ncbi:hypothetical protein ACFV7Q_27155 [Streptomyces sp. NPDC059851]|uniref:hypothetical protein n=1 Tax=Streptomyces sp. NPDC059851 TaxID=3346971 RepID=UPI0036471FC6